MLQSASPSVVVREYRGLIGCTRNSWWNSPHQLLGPPRGPCRCVTIEEFLASVILAHQPLLTGSLLILLSEALILHGLLKEDFGAARL